MSTILKRETEVVIVEAEIHFSYAFIKFTYPYRKGYRVEDDIKQTIPFIRHVEAHLCDQNQAYSYQVNYWNISQVFG